MSSAIIIKDKVVWTNGYGYEDLESKTLVETNTLFHQGSVTKTITVAAFLHLWENSNFNLDEDINNYLPFELRNPNHKTSPITFRMLLTHTSSISDVNISQMNNKMGSLNTNIDAPKKLESILKSFLVEGGSYYYKENYFTGQPGSEYAYSNVAFSLLGLLIEQIFGQSFIDYTREYIFNPLLMNNTAFLLSETDINNFAFQYIIDREDAKNLLKVEPFTWAGYMDGSLRTSAKEYSNFLIMLLNNGVFNDVQVLSKETINVMLELQDLPGKQSARTFKPLGRALLWNFVEDENIKFYHFNGYGSGFFTEVFFSPENKIAGLFFVTGQYSSFPLMGQSILEIVKKLMSIIKIP